MPSRCCRAVLAAALLWPVLTPTAPKREVADTYFGTIVADPYRWMEAPVGQNPEFMDWLRKQNRYTREVLDRQPVRTALILTSQRQVVLIPHDH